MKDNYITVTQLTRYIKFKIDNDEHLKHIFLRGEISNFKAHTRGHYYFTLKDENSRINAVMFATDVKNMKFVPEDGMKVLVTGRISVYEANGGYQIYVSEMNEDGIGNLYVAFEQLKKKLESEGLFDKGKKKPIPKMPETIGIITAPTGAAIRDILSTIKRRFPLAKTILFPSLVQGKEAAPDIVKQIKKANQYNLDVLIVGRGGGSIEDLWCFNEEEVARAIYDSKIPIISAVGHEIDFTIADFVADLRAPTPTGAAEMAVPNYHDIIDYINQYQLRLKQNIYHILSSRKEQLNRLTKSYILENPFTIFQVKEQQFDHLFERLKQSSLNIIDKNKIKLHHLLDNYILKNKKEFVLNKQKDYQKLFERFIFMFNKNIEMNEHKYLNLLSKLETLNPLLTLKRGYAIARINKKAITSVKKIKKDEILEIELQDGKFKTKVI